MKNLIPIEHAKASGIYIIRNSVNAKVYVGSTVLLAKRFREHHTALKRNGHHSKLLQRFANKYGIETLSFELLALCTVSELLKVEQQFLDQFQCYKSALGFNTCLIAGTSLGVKHSEETRQKVRLANLGKKLTPEHRAKVSAAGRGRKQSAEHIEKRAAAKRGVQINKQGRLNMSKAQKQRHAENGPQVLSQETRSKISAARKGIVFSPEHRVRLSAAKMGNRNRLGGAQAI
jgi:group I intron endonuclease